MREVRDFIVVAPANQAKAAAWAEQRLAAYLAAKFPHYRFRLEPYGPFAEEDDFAVLPIVNSIEDSMPGDDRIYLCKPLDPQVIPHIRRVLREFDLAGAKAN